MKAKSHSCPRRIRHWTHWDTYEVQTGPTDVMDSERRLHRTARGHARRFCSRPPREIGFRSSYRREPERTHPLLVDHDLHLRAVIHDRPWRIDVAVCFHIAAGPA